MKDKLYNTYILYFLRNFMVPLRALNLLFTQVTARRTSISNSHARNDLSSYISTVKKQDHQITEEAEKSKGELRVSNFLKFYDEF